DAEARGAALVALAMVAAAASVETIQATARIAWTSRLSDVADRAMAVALGRRPAARFVGPAVVRVSGAPARSVWGLSRPDGSIGFAVASGDGEVLFAGAPSGDAPLRRLEGS